MAAGADGRLQGGPRDGARVLPEPARQRARRSAAGGQRRRAGDHPGDRGMLPPLGAPALPGASDAQPRGQGSDRPVARIQGARQRLLSGAVAGDRAPTGGRHPRRLRRSPAQRACLFRGRFRGLHRPPAAARHPSSLHSDDESPRTAVRRGATQAQDYSQHPNGFGEKPVLKLMFGALIRAADRWRGLRFTEFELRQIAAVRKELDQEYEASITPLARSSQPRVSSKSAP